jgi:defect-in-organelle-trafficking protein DotA
MKKRLFFLILAFFPVMTLAETLSFAPPPSDYSVGWLADIFGIVDGVLHGTGSQIIGAMFEIFNAAIMALGGMIITYTMLVSTLNTAHEGEMLGKKWSSIWVPVRATVGFALLVPKASGYCLLQIFVMWIVVQGVGAADKLWAAALSYLNRGGVIIQEQSSLADIGSSSSMTKMYQGAAVMLSGQVCMLALEKILKNNYASFKSISGGLCTSTSATSNNIELQNYCNSGTVPSFVDSISFEAVNTPIQNTYMTTEYNPSVLAWNEYNTDMNNWNNCVSNCSPYVSCNCGPEPTKPPPIPEAAKPVVMPLPNFDNTHPFFSQLNGVCGFVTWRLFSGESLGSVQNSNLSSGQLSNATNARVIALQQMYSDLLTVARVIVNNDPNAIFEPPLPPTETKTGQFKSLTSIKSDQEQSGQTPAAGPPKSYTEPFGVPTTGSSGGVCQAECPTWGPDPSITTVSGTLMNGTEVYSAIMDYNSVIRPTLTLIQLGRTGVSANAEKAFIADANASGWIMAGTYFFDLVQLNNTNKAASQAVATDANSGLDESVFTLKNLYNQFYNGGSAGCPNTAALKVPSGTRNSPPSPSPPVLCQLTNTNPEILQPIYQLLSGEPISEPSDAVPSPAPSSIDPNVFTNNAQTLPSVGDQGSSVFGYLNNALKVQIPGVPTPPPLKFANVMHANFQNTNFNMPDTHFSCMGVKIIFVELCIGRWIGEIVYNGIIVNVINALSSWLLTLIYGLIMNLMMIPLDAMASIFTVSIKILDVNGINPIVALAKMGTYYINFVGKLWFDMLIAQVVDMVLSIFGLVMLPFFLMAMPITIAFAGVMAGIGFVTAYYVPLIPYIIFLFGALAWFMAVIEAMVAAPIVALGVIHPEGHDIFGKGEAAVMILMNVFLRPAMMIIGYVAAISLSYVGIWMLNSGFDHAVGFMQPSTQRGSITGTLPTAANFSNVTNAVGDGGKNLVKEGNVAGALSGGAQSASDAVDTGIAAVANTIGVATHAVGDAIGSVLGENVHSDVPGAGSVSGGYTQWAGVFAFFFSIIVYTTLYMTLVEKAFSLITLLPDKVLRWIGGQPEQYGQEAASWAGEGKKAVEAQAKEGSSAMTAAGQAVELPKPEEGSITM